MDDREWSWLAWKESTKLARRSRPSLSWIRRPRAPHRMKARQQAAGSRRTCGATPRPSEAAAPRVLPGLKVGACTRQPRRGRRARRNKSPERGRAAAYTDRRAWQTAEPGVRCAGVSEQPGGGGCEKRTRILSSSSSTDIYLDIFLFKKKLLLSSTHVKIYRRRKNYVPTIYKS